MILPVLPPEQPADFKPPEPMEEQPRPSVASIDQSGSLEEDKGALTEAVAETTIHVSYPAISRRRGEEGIVVLSFDITQNGVVSNIQIKLSSGRKRLDKAAVKAVENARFQPATRFGKPIQSTETKTFNFRLTDD
jgi:protein TonB